MDIGIDQIIDLAVVIGVTSTIALPFAMGAIYVTICALLRSVRDARYWRDRHAEAKRRLDDVDALRARSPLAPEGWELIDEAAKIFREYESWHRELMAAAVSEDAAHVFHTKAARDSQMADRMETFLSRCPGIIRDRAKGRDGAEVWWRK